MRPRAKCLMVAVADLDAAANRIVAKAAQIAKHCGATLHVVHIFAHPHVPSGRNAAERSEEIVSPLSMKLEKLVSRPRRAGLRVLGSVVWDYPAADAIVRQVMSHRPDLLLIQSSPRSRLDRWLMTHTDWELVRECPCPVWISRSNNFPARASVLAAIDPYHAHAKSTKLDGQILAVAGGIAASTRDRLGACFVYPLPPTAVPLPGVPVVVPVTPEEARELRARASRAVDRMAGAKRIAAKDRVIVPGEAAAMLPLIAKRWRANVLVMGAVSRSGLKRIFIGNTAERILDSVDCDVLVVKPKSFMSSVPSRLRRG